MFTTLLAAATVGLALAPAAFADEATADLNLTRSDCNDSTDVLGLSYETGAYSGACGNLPGIAVSTDAYAGDTLPLPVTIDTSRPVTIRISLATQSGLPAFGDQTVGVDLTGTTTKNKSVALGSDQVVKPATEMLRGGNYIQEFTLPSSATKGGPYKSFSLDLSVGGSINGGYVGVGGLSVVSIPVADDAILFPPDEG